MENDLRRGLRRGLRRDRHVVLYLPPEVGGLRQRWVNMFYHAQLNNLTHIRSYAIKAD